MLVSFNPAISRQQNPKFGAAAMMNTEQADRYMIGIGKTRNVQDLKETIRLTEQAGKKAAVKVLKMAAEDLGIKLN